MGGHYVGNNKTAKKMCGAKDTVLRVGRQLITTNHPLGDGQQVDYSIDNHK